jgi:hypothetical protein
MVLIIIKPYLKLLPLHINRNRCQLSSLCSSRCSLSGIKLRNGRHNIRLKVPIKSITNVENNSPGWKSPGLDLKLRNKNVCRRRRTEIQLLLIAGSVILLQRSNCIVNTSMKCTERRSMQISSISC